MKNNACRSIRTSSASLIMLLCYLSLEIGTIAMHGSTVCMSPISAVSTFPTTD